MQRVFDDDRFPTRLGIPQVTLRLARTVGGKLAPWTGSGPFGWQSSEVRVPAYRYEKLQGVDQERPDIEALRKDWPNWTRASVFVAPVAEDGAICGGMTYDADRGVEFVA